MAKGNRHEAVLIRISTDEQDVAGQISNVKIMLKQRDIKVPDKHWLKLESVRRKNILTSPQFAPLLEEVRNDRVGTIYVEKQDRFGGKNSKEFFAMLGTLQEHGTKLIDLTDNLDLTSDEQTDELRALLGSQRSKAELQSLSRRTLRTKIHRFKEKGGWPSGAPPFGFGKQCISPEGKVRWEWHPTESKTYGQVYNVTKGSKQVLGESKVKIPRKAREDANYLVPNKNKAYIKTVQLIFDLFANQGLSRIAIAKQMEQQGRLCYNRPFDFSMINEIIKNMAYIGHTVFGKTRSGDYYTFDSDGALQVVSRDAAGVTQRRTDGIIQRNTHDPLIDAKTWSRAQARVKREFEQTAQGKTSLAPTSSRFWLKGVLVCGHCGGYLTGRTDKGVVRYNCPTYNNSNSRGEGKGCGFLAITHAEAEQMIAAKLKEMGKDFNAVTSNEAKHGVEDQMHQMCNEGEESYFAYHRTIEEGVKVLQQFLRDEYELTSGELKQLAKAARRLYVGEPQGNPGEYALTLRQLKGAINSAEQKAVKRAEKLFARLDNEHTKLTFHQARCTPAQHDKMRPQVLELEEQMQQAKAQAMPIGQRLAQYREQMATHHRDEVELINHWVTMDDFARGEALRRMMKVHLFWRREWHRPEAKPKRARKTERPGRWSYTVEKNKTRWEISGLRPSGAW